jgi:16S rRNA processing protein RimM
MNGIYEPLFVQSYNCTDLSSGQIVFEGVSGRGGAERFNNKELFLSEEHEQKYFAEDEEVDDLIGYKVVIEGNEIGVITDIEIMPMQELFVVDMGGREVLIPFVDDFIEDIDDEAKTITLNLPEGLLDL